MSFVCELCRQFGGVGDGDGDLGAEGCPGAIEGRQAGGDPTAFEAGDGRLGRADELGELSLTQALLLPQGSDLERKPNGPAPLS